MFIHFGLCLYYSHERDWRHPHAPNNDEWGGNARPKYDPPEPSYAYGKDHDLRNTGPLPDGSIHAGDEETLREVGRRLRKDGFPKLEGTL